MIPTHGWSCRTRTFRTDCRDCRDPVFFMSCNCGSAVLFDELGPPWPKHLCDTIQKMEVKIEELGKETVEWALAQRMMTRRFDVASIEPSYAKHLVLAVRKPQPELQRMDCYPGLLERIQGVVRELIRSVDLCQKFGVEPGSIAAQLLGKRFPKNAAQLTVHSGALGDQEDPESYTFIADRQLVREIIVGDLVSVSLFGVEVPGQSAFWVAQEIRFGL